MAEKHKTDEIGILWRRAASFLPLAASHAAARGCVCIKLFATFGGEAYHHSAIPAKGAENRLAARTKSALARSATLTRRRRGVLNPRISHTPLKCNRAWLGAHACSSLHLLRNRRRWLTQ